MIGPLGRLGAAATLGQHCPQMTTDVQILWNSIFGPCCDDVIASALVQYKGPCNNGNEDVEEMSRSVKICILNWKLTLIHNISCDIFQLKTF